jgi:hypothetical protein
MPEHTLQSHHHPQLKPPAENSILLLWLCALQWLLAKEDQELNVMRGQSSSWFFIEELDIGMLSVNVTLSLTSTLDLTGQVGAAAAFLLFLLLLLGGIW